MPKEKRFQVTLSDEDQLDIELRIIRGRVEGFTINYRAVVQGSWREIVRYDTSHGHLHLHRFWLPAHERITPLEDPRRPKPPYDWALKHSEEDLISNWEVYKHRFEASLKVRPDGKR